MAKRARRWIVGLCLGLASGWTLPRLICGTGAQATLDEPAEQTRLADAVASRIKAEDGQLYASKSSRFNGQSAIAFYQMAILGLGQILIDSPELTPRYLPAMRAAADALADVKTHPYAATKYGTHGLVRLAPGQGHAYLGYVNMAFGMLRYFDPNTKHAALNDRITQHHMRELARSPRGIIDTYPGEDWPPDVAAVIGGIALHGLATKTDYTAFLQTWQSRFRRCAMHPSGFLIQRLQEGSCTRVDAPRGSGTAVGAYMLSFSRLPIAADMYRALASSGKRSLAGFAAFREYADGFEGTGDLNAGPIVFGLSVGATGFGLGAAAAHDDRDGYLQLYRSARLFGMPSRHGYAAGGAVGNALLLAMLTARPTGAYGLSR